MFIVTDGGKFNLLYVPTDKRDAVRDAFRDYRKFPFMMDPFGNRWLFNVKKCPTK